MIGLPHEVAEGGAGVDVLADVADDREAQPVVDELLGDLAGDAGAEVEEAGVEPLDRHRDGAGTMRPRVADEVGGVVG